MCIKNHKCGKQTLSIAANHIKRNNNGTKKKHKCGKQTSKNK